MSHGPPPPDSGQPASLAHVLAVQAALRATVEALLAAGTMEREAVARLLERRATEMRDRRTDPDWLRAAHVVETWAYEIRTLGNFAK